MLSRHWRLWLSFPSLALPPEEQLGIGLTFLPNLRAHASWARFLVLGLWSRRLTEPPRPANIPGEAASLQEAPPPDPLPKNSWGSRGIFLHTWFPPLGAVSYLLLGCGHGG